MSSNGGWAKAIFFCEKVWPSLLYIVHCTHSTASSVSPSDYGLPCRCAKGPQSGSKGITESNVAWSYTPEEVLSFQARL